MNASRSNAEPLTIGACKERGGMVGLRATACSRLNQSLYNYKSRKNEEGRRAKGGAKRPNTALHIQTLNTRVKNTVIKDA